MGMAIFFLFYGLAETINAIYIYTAKKEWFNLVVTAFWGMAFVIVGLVELLKLDDLKNLAYILYGISWVPLMFAPCSIKFLRKNKWTMLLRKFFFLIIASGELALVLLK